MTPKEKAQELVQRFIDEAYAETTEQLYTPIAKKAALIAVDEINKYVDDSKLPYPYDEYWYAVQQEIENL